jgi:hypothetical protein
MVKRKLVNYVLVIYHKLGLRRICKNTHAQHIILNASDISQIDKIAERFCVKGSRYTEEVMKIYGFNE